MRIILMCGKGGTGKSTLAAAMAVRAAHQGARTLLFSVDPAHSLGPVLGVPVASCQVRGDSRNSLRKSRDETMPLRELSSMTRT